MVRRWGRELRYRLDAASKVGFGLDVLNVASISYMLWFSAFLVTTRRAAGQPVWWGWIAFQAGAVVYTALVYPRLQGRTTKTKWTREEAKRTESLALALNSLAAGLRDGRFSSEQLSRIEHGILVAMASKVEALFQDAEGIYFAVCLLVSDAGDPSRMAVLARSNQDRDLGVKYPREKVLAWAAMTSKRMEYNPDYSPAPGDPPKPYKSVLAFPLLFSDSSKTQHALGGASVDSARRHHFDGFERKVEIDLAPYLGLLAIVLICRQRYNAWPDYLR